MSNTPFYPPVSNLILADKCPSEEAVSKIQNVEKIVIPELHLDYPSPLFRYAVHFYPK